MNVGFSAATTVMFGLKQTLMLHLITATNNALRSTFGRAWYMTFWLGLACYPHGSVHGFTGLFWKKRCQARVVPAWRGCAPNLHVRSDNIWPPLATIARMDDVDLWLGFPVHRTSHQRASSYEATLKDWFTRHQLILKRISLPSSLRELQPSGSDLAILRAHVNLCFFGIAYISKLVAIHLNICFKFLNIYIYIYIYIYIAG